MDLKDKKVVIAGSFLTIEKQADGKAMLEKLGAKVTGSVSSKTDYLLLGLDGGAKATKAEELGTAIISELDVLEAAKKVNREGVETGAKMPLDHSLRSVFDWDELHDTRIFAIDGHEVVYGARSAQAIMGFTGPSALEELLGKKSLEKIEGICVGSGYGNSKCNNYAKLLIQHAGKLKNLKYLAFETMRGEVNVNDILDAFPLLEGLYVLRSDIESSGPIRHAELKEFHALGASATVGELLSTSSFPKLTHIQVYNLSKQLVEEVSKLDGLRHFGYEEAVNKEQDMACLSGLTVRSTVESFALADLGVNELETLSGFTWWSQLKHLHLSDCTINGKVKFLKADALPNLEYVSFGVSSTKRLIGALSSIKFAPYVGFGFPSCSMGASEALALRTLALSKQSRFLNISHNHLTSDKQLNLCNAMPCPVEVKNQQQVPMEYDSWE